MTDVHNPLGDTHREIGHRRIAAGEARSAIIRRSYEAPIEEVWEACIDPERLNRWFLQVTGDLHVGGTFELDGNAGGEILRCEPPRLLTASWINEERPADEVELRLTAGQDGHTVFELEHASVANVFLNDPETGIWGVGTGWEMPLTYGLTRYLRGELPDLPASEWYEPDPEDLEIAEQICDAWAEVVEAADNGEG